MVQEWLAGMGHEVFTAGQGEQGIACAVAQRPDVALIDIGLPGIDGYEVARQIRTAMGDGSPYLIAVTGHTGAEARAKAEQAGFDMHLSKPVDLAKLLQLVLRG